MPHCCNCGCDIPADDKIRLCDKCKRIILPFIKFMDASTSSAVRRLVSNEGNLRNAGVTDGGMEYLLRVCELHDKMKQQEREARERERAEESARSHAPEIIETPSYTDIELPLDEPLNLIRGDYGKALPVSAAVFAILTPVSLVSAFLPLPTWISPVMIALGMANGAYLAVLLTKILKDLTEIKNHFR